MVKTLCQCQRIIAQSTTCAVPFSDERTVNRGTITLTISFDVSCTDGRILRVCSSCQPFEPSRTIDLYIFLVGPVLITRIVHLCYFQMAVVCLFTSTIMLQ